eukprot:6466897-Amphidinium_carterae.2
MASIKASEVHDKGLQTRIPRSAKQVSQWQWQARKDSDQGKANSMQYRARNAEEKAGADDSHDL